MKLTNFYKNKFLINDNKKNMYSFNKNERRGGIRILNACRIRIKILNNFFSPIKVISSKPVFTIKNDEVVINLFYYTGKRTIYPLLLLYNKNTKKHYYKYDYINPYYPKVGLNYNSINNLGELLSKLFERKVKLQFVKLHYPYMNRSILAKYLRINSKRIKFRQMKNKLFKKLKIVKNNTNRVSNLPSVIVGIKLQISGRLEKERVRPRKTVSTVQKGTITGDKNIIIDMARYTRKNRKGAYTVKVWITQQVSSPINLKYFLLNKIYILKVWRDMVYKCK